MRRSKLQGGAALGLAAIAALVSLDALAQAPYPEPAPFPSPSPTPTPSPSPSPSPAPYDAGGFSFDAGSYLDAGGR